MAASTETGSTPSIVLANGFSQAWKATIFNYKNLLQKANFRTRHTEIKELFDSFETFDFEKIMLALSSAEKVCETYDFPRHKIDEIKDDQEQLKNSLIDAISKTHPERSSFVTTDEYEKAKPFIFSFRKVFTLNGTDQIYMI
ncbi:DUF4917 family protein [Shewanella sp. 202IG2-18]|uniref:DUF4917 family protein n=1 Tax=Parashewanella hymeniacidonis TaxID=2807618 RepID=UPI001961D3EF|nr:DUF4917 family protein [Parashewanella hymeniacidonis]MBM7074415.1 DUF4917 family protein [Parashewanella hymeniacidonis]